MTRNRYRVVTETKDGHQGSVLLECVAHTDLEAVLKLADDIMMTGPSRVRMLDKVELQRLQDDLWVTVDMAESNHLKGLIKPYDRRRQGTRNCCCCCCK